MSTQAHIEALRTLYDESYRQTAADYGTDRFDGWISTYDEQPMPTTDMVQWRADITALVLAGRPKRVLDVGCGTGMLTAAILNSGAQYWGTDLATAAIESLGRACPNVRATLRCQAADDRTGLPRGYFDTIVLNSVTQYFPSAPYLDRVLYGLVELLRPGGRIVIGDVRDLRTLRAFTLAAWAARLRGQVSATELRSRVDATLRRTSELLLSPWYFTRLPGFSAVEILAKPGWSHNEITRHRYNVMLHTASPGADFAAARRWDWLDRAALARRLELRRSPLWITNLPNARLAGEWGAVHALDRGESTEVVYGWLDGEPPPAAVEPEYLNEAGCRAGYRVRIVPSPRAWNLVDALFTPYELDPLTASGRVRPSPYTLDGNHGRIGSGTGHPVGRPTAAWLGPTHPIVGTGVLQRVARP